jgi:hypothetical protein
MRAGELTGLSKVTSPSDTIAATVVDARGFERDANWKTVSVVTFSLPSMDRKPKPAAYCRVLFQTTAMARPGTPIELLALTAACPNVGRASSANEKFAGVIAAWTAMKPIHSAKVLAFAETHILELLQCRKGTMRAVERMKTGDLRELVGEPAVGC